MKHLVISHELENKHNASKQKATVIFLSLMQTLKSEFPQGFLLMPWGKKYQDESSVAFSQDQKPND